MSEPSGLPPESLEARNKGSLIRYIGALQTELALVYAAGLPRKRAGIKDRLDFYEPPALKLADYEDTHLQRRDEAARDERDGTGCERRDAVRGSDVRVFGQPAETGDDR